MQEINEAVDEAILARSGFMQGINASVNKAASSLNGFIQVLENNPVKPPAPHLHRKAVAKRKKRKNGGHK